MSCRLWLLKGITYMKKSVCVDCEFYKKTVMKIEGGKSRETRICEINNMETRRFDVCPCGYTEEEIVNIRRKGEIYDNIRYREELADVLC